MASGYRPNATTDFLEEWKAKREKMRAKMLGDIAASTGACSVAPAGPALGINSKTQNNESVDNGHAGGGGGGSAPVSWVSSHPVLRSSSSAALTRRVEDEQQHTSARDTPERNPKKTPQPEKAPATPQSAGSECEKESPSPVTGSSKSKEKSSGPSARKGKGKGQIERRKLREKRRSTGVVRIPSNEKSAGSSAESLLIPPVGRRANSGEGVTESIFFSLAIQAHFLFLLPSCAFVLLKT
ncbi:hypothetical protein GJAV_G00270870 [Gymnothorax javanicus]|nr:hypothetical protein GJAV_G00270870 [Gymnothorax javanicus]